MASCLHAVEAELTKPSVIKEGHLLKLGRSVLKLPKLKYFVLRPSGIYCFKTRLMQEARSFMALEDISLSVCNIMESNSEQYCLRLSDRRRQHILACSSVDIRNCWVTAILTAITQRMMDEPHFILRKRVGSASLLTPDPQLEQDVQCQFTSPFWLQDNDRLRVPRSPGNSESRMHGRRRTMSKSLSLGDLGNLFSDQSPNLVAPRKTKLSRKRSVHDITRHFFGYKPASSEAEALTSKPPSPNKLSTRKRRWSLFGHNITSTTTTTTTTHTIPTIFSETKDNIKKNGPHGSPLICDTKL